MKRAVVGHGQAKKEQVQQMVMRLLALPGVPGKDAADALGLAICHAHARQQLRGNRTQRGARTAKFGALSAGAKLLEARAAGSARRQSAPHVCPLRRRRQVPRRPGDERDRKLAAGRARLRQARQGQGRERAAALRPAPSPTALLASAGAIAADIDLDLAWEFAPEGEFGFADAGARLLRRIDRHGAAGRRAARRCSARRTTSAASAKAASRKRPRRR